jgi:hypothetical protein
MRLEISPPINVDLGFSLPHDLQADQLDKEYSSLIENDTLTVCKENPNDLRQFVNVVAESTSSTTSTTTSPNSHGKLPIIYFVTPTYPR